MSNRFEKSKYMLYGLIFLLVISLMGFIATAILISNQTPGWDNKVLNEITSEHRNSFLDSIMLIITYAGDLIFWGIIIVYLLIFGDFEKKRIGLILIIGLCISSLLVLGLKEGFARDRPAVPDDKILENYYSNYSFPSGHTARGFFGFVVIFANFKKRYSLPTLGLVILVAYSRLYCGVHYPTDIIGGAFLGICIAAILSIFDHIIRIKQKLKQNS